MGKFEYLLVVGLLAGICVAPLSAPRAVAGGESCTGLASVVGCPNVRGEVGGGGATLSGDQATPGSPGGSAPGAGGSGSSSAATPPQPCTEVLPGLCRGDNPTKPGDGGDGNPGTPAVTLSDLAHFRPSPAIQRMQPDGWMVVGLDTNFYALIDRHVVHGTLLGASADVRFTPVAYRWRYGDGTSARLLTKGASWSSLGVAEFDPTPTSHVYRASGTYVIDLDVEYTAEYRFARGGWVRLTGTIVLPANPLTATAGDAVTVLVDRHCAQPPTGPGC